MLRRRNSILLIPAALLAMGVLAGCELDENQPCESNDDCADGEVCANIDPETGEGECVAETPDGCTDDSDCTSNFACDSASSECFTECTSNDQCAADATCNTDNGSCESSTPAEWVYVAVISATTDNEDINETTTPGPDIDAIELSSGGQSFFADFIESNAQGDGGDGGSENNFPNVNAVLDQNDAIPTGGGECNLENDNPEFWSMGDTSGYVVVSFPNQQAIVDGDTITVWELDDLICNNVEVTRADTYEVYIGNDDVNIGSVNATGDISGTNWLSLGAAPGSGGVEDFPVALPE